jgi:hypothetical protein
MAWHGNGNGMAWQWLVGGAEQSCGMTWQWQWQWQWQWLVGGAEQSCGMALLQRNSATVRARANIGVPRAVRACAREGALHVAHRLQLAVVRVVQVLRSQSTSQSHTREYPTYTCAH